jgi:hypothetical protein
VRTLLYEAANVMPTRYKGQLKLKDWAFAIVRRSTMRKARRLPKPRRAARSPRRGPPPLVAPLGRLTAARGVKRF